MRVSFTHFHAAVRGLSRSMCSLAAAASELTITPQCVQVRLYAAALLPALTARQRLKELSAKEAEAVQLRVCVEPGGCDGFQYGFEIEPSSGTAADDR